jgi:hypothetical protein
MVSQNKEGRAQRAPISNQSATGYDFTGTFTITSGLSGIFLALPSPEHDLRRAQTLWELGLALQGQNKNVEGSAVLERSASISEKLGPAWVKRGAELRKLRRVPAKPGQNR